LNKVTIQATSGTSPQATGTLVDFSVQVQEYIGGVNTSTQGGSQAIGSNVTYSFPSVDATYQVVTFQTFSDGAIFYQNIPIEFRLLPSIVISGADWKRVTLNSLDCLNIDLEMVSAGVSGGRTIAPFAFDGNDTPIGGNPYIGQVQNIVGSPYTIGFDLGLDMTEWTDLNVGMIFGAAMGGQFCTN
jgi:hypothetical protein